MFAWISQNILTLLIALPLLGALVTLLLPAGKILRGWALLNTLLTFVASWHLVYYFQNQAGYQFAVDHAWIPALGMRYALAVDGLSLWLILLTTFLLPLAVLYSMGSVRDREKTYYFFLLVLEAAMIGSFCALDGFLFYLFWEAMLIPMYFLIGMYGHGKRVYAAVKFFVFTLLGSVLMLIAMLYLYYQADRSFLLGEWLTLSIGPRTQLLLFAAFALSFAIKVPLFPLHTWLPDAHTEAPTAGSVILAGVLLKMGTYGFARFAMPLFPDAVMMARPLLVVLAVIGIIYGAMVAMVQKDLKRLIAYSSIAHLGFVMLGLLALTPQAVSGAIYQMLNHGISAAGLFLMVGMLYDRTHTREIADYGGIAKAVPLYTVLFLILTMASVALPSTNGFIGEFLILSGSFGVFRWATIFATVGVILSAVYMLWMVERVFFGPLANDKLAGLKDLKLVETLCLLPLIVAVFWMGLGPNFFLSKINLATSALIQRIEGETSRQELTEARRP